MRKRELYKRYDYYSRSENSKARQLNGYKKISAPARRRRRLLHNNAYADNN